MSILKLYRKSGDPVNKADRDAYSAEWKTFFDKVSDRVGLDMLKKQRMLAFGERQLIKKHNKEVVVDMPSTKEAWAELISTYEDTPIMLARTTDGKEVVAIIMDGGFD